MYNNQGLIPCPRQNGGQMGVPGQVPSIPGAMMPMYQAGMFPSPIIGATLPTGMPTGPSPTPVPAPIDTGAPSTVQDVLFTPGFLRTQIGRRMRVEFLIGTNALIDRTGTLVGVGASYILLRPVDSDDIMLCDIYSIKFATILY